MGEWAKRSPGGIYRRIAGDGRTVIASVVRGPVQTQDGGYRIAWNLVVHPKGEGNGHEVFREGYKTLREAKIIAEIVFKSARTQLSQGTYPI